MSIAQRLLDESIKREIHKARVEAYREAVKDVSDWIADSQSRGEILALEIRRKFAAPQEPHQ